MTKEHLNEIMASLCKKLMIDKSDLVAIHEAALVALGIDSNAVPYGLDFLVLRGLGDAGVSKLSIDGFDIRLHAPENFEANGPISLVAPRGMDFPSLAPETILETISKSPSCRYLMEQRAALAELLHFDDMDDDELRQHSPYIRDSFLISVSQIGELVSKISPETCRRYFPDIEWQQIRGMRNIIVHVYANVDYDIVWDVVNEEAPKLKQTLLKNDDIRREYESTLVVEEDIEEDILGYFGALDPIVGDGVDGRIPQDGNRP